MQRNRKLVILAVFMTVAILVWVPRSKRITSASATISPATLDQTMPTAGTLLRKRTEFADWGRDPLAQPQKENEEEKDNGLSNLRLAAIMWSDQEPTAFVNDAIMHVGDRVADKTVKRIEHNSVILTDGTKDYVLRLQE